MVERRQQRRSLQPQAALRWGGGTVDGKGRWQRVEEKSAAEEAGGGRYCEGRGYRRAYKDVFCDGGSDHRDSLSVSFCSA
jgi:hypothetical protein